MPQRPQDGSLASIALVMVAVGSASATPRPDAYCQNDSKLLGSYELSTEYRDWTWWKLTRDGFDAAGITDYKGAIEGFFGTTFDTLDQAVQTVVDAVKPVDKNENNYVCASNTRGTRAFTGDPNATYYLFSVNDDKLGKS